MTTSGLDNVAVGEIVNLSALKTPSTGRKGRRGQRRGMVSNGSGIPPHPVAKESLHEEILLESS